ncbi:MAG: hypothetical protein KC621_04755 [Myxococcales bacterium]|nr:hypothetical protein [Myxococcales bacterium]
MDRQLVTGIVLTVAVDAVISTTTLGAWWVLFATAYDLGPSLFELALVLVGGGIGLFQWLWLLPAGGRLLRRRRSLGIGMWIGGALVMLLNGLGVAALLLL